MQVTYLKQIIEIILLVIGIIVLIGLHMDYKDIPKYLFNKKLSNPLQSRSGIQCYFIGGTILLLIMMGTLAVGLGGVKEAFSNRPEFLFVICYILIVFAILMVLEVVFIRFKRQVIQIEDLQKKYADKQLNMYHRIHTINEEKRIFQQDAVKHIEEIKCCNRAEQLDLLIKQANHLIDDTEMKPQLLTGNKLIDAILSEKYAIAQAAHVKMSAEVSMPEELNLDGNDLCLMFSETLDVILNYYKQAIDVLGSIHIKGIWLKGYFILNFDFLKSSDEEKMQSFCLEKELEELMICLKRHKGKIEIREEDNSYKIDIIFNLFGEI